MLKALWTSNLLKITAVFMAGIFALSAAFQPKIKKETTSDNFEIKDDTPLWKVMTKLGKIKAHVPKDPDDKSLLVMGKSLVENGYAVRNGSRSKSINKKMACVACHNRTKEFSMLKNFDPEVKLRYADTAQIGFLPGSSMYGMVNRAMFFNHDLLKQYKGPKGDLLVRAHYNLREAIDACNYVLAGGRKMKEWEKEAILVYLWSLELKMGELNLSDEHKTKIQYSVKHNRSNARAVNLLRLYYPEIYPAHLIGEADKLERRMISPVVSNFYVGRILYERSCLHCHANRKYAKLKLDYKRATFKKLKNNFETTSKWSLYRAHRVGPNEKWNGNPFYTKEHLSNNQLKDLRYFIQTMAKMGDEALVYYGDNH